MSAKPRKKRVEPETFKTSWSTYLGRGIMTTLTVLLIFYVALLAVSRTKGFRALVVERFESFTGLEVKLESCSMNPFLHLSMVDFLALDKDTKRPASMSMKRVKVQWKPLHVFSSKPAFVKSVRVEGLKVDLQVGEEPLPACFEVLAPAGKGVRLLNLEREVARFLQQRANIDAYGFPLEVQGERLRWWEASKKLLEMEGFTFSYSPHATTMPPVHLFALTAESLGRVGVPVLGPVELKCIQEGQDIAFIKAQADRGTRPRKFAEVRQDAAPADASDQPRRRDLEEVLRESLEEAVSN